MSDTQETPLSAFYRWERDTPDAVFLRQPVSDIWKSWTYKQSGNEIRRLASALLALDLPAASNIAILSKNCAHWIMADLAIMMAGHVSVPLYPTLPAAALTQVLEHSGARVIFLGKLDDYDAQRDAIKSDVRKISFPLYGPADGDRWEDILTSHQPLHQSELRDPDDIASIVYSSGTTGTPKGAMLSFGAFGFVGVQVKTYLRLTKPQRFFSYLPLSHIAERALMEMVAISSGSAISFAGSLETFMENLQHERPSIFGGVPRIFTKFREGVLEKMPQRKLDRLLALPGVNIFVKRAILKKLGLAKARVVVCGAAPTPVALLGWFNKLGMDIRETYGMTENTAYSHSNFRLIRNGTVGQPWPEVDVRIGENEEILVRHPALMKGYYKDPETTASVFTEEGFLRTGDQGTVDAQGFLTITGRIKDQFKTAKAKFVAPAPIELKLSINTDIDHACVVGKGLAQPMALVTLSASGRSRSQRDVEARLLNDLKRVNSDLEKHEQLHAVIVVADEWSIANGLLTPSMKIKRNAVEKLYEPVYPEWFDENVPVIWQMAPQSEKAKAAVGTA